jgi:hypothetical protein
MPLSCNACGRDIPLEGECWRTPGNVYCLECEDAIQPAQRGSAVKVCAQGQAEIAASDPEGSR